MVSLRVVSVQLNETEVSHEVDNKYKTHMGAMFNDVINSLQYIDRNRNIWTRTLDY